MVSPGIADGGQVTVITGRKTSSADTGVAAKSENKTTTRIRDKSFIYFLITNTTYIIYQEYNIILSNKSQCHRLVTILIYTEQEKRKEQGKKLHQADEQIFRRAETLLYNELALVLDIKPEQVVPFINEQIAIEELKPKK